MLDSDDSRNCVCVRNEVAVNAFLRGQIKFLQIYDVIEYAMTRREVLQNPTLEDLLAEDSATRRLATEFIKEEFA